MKDDDTSMDGDKGHTEECLMYDSLYWNCVASSCNASDGNRSVDISSFFVSKTKHATIFKLRRYVSVVENAGEASIWPSDTF